MRILLILLLAIPAFANDWEQISDEDGIKVFRREVEGSPVLAFRGETVIDASVAKITGVLSDSSKKNDWVSDLLKAYDIKKISEVERIEYNATDAPWPVKNRDFVFHAKGDFDPKARTMTFNLKSTEDATVPPNDDHVRGELLHSKYVLKELSPTQTHTTVEIQVDPKGALPKWVANLVQKKWPRKTLSGIRKQVAKAEVAEHAHTAKLFAGKN